MASVASTAKNTNASTAVSSLIYQRIGERSSEKFAIRVCLIGLSARQREYQRDNLHASTPGKSQIRNSFGLCLMRIV